MQEIEDILEISLKLTDNLKKYCETKAITSQINSDKPKIAIIIDEEGWAYDNIAIQIKKNLSNYYDIDIIPSEVYDKNPIRLFVLLKQYRYDLVHMMWRGHLSELHFKEIQFEMKKVGFELNEFIKEYVEPQNISTAIYDHFFLTEDTLFRTKLTAKYAKNYYVCSSKLRGIYNEISEIEKPKMVITDGVDLEKFYPVNLERFDNIENRKIVIGWVGNSKAVDSENDDDLKGVRKIIIPCINELIEEGYPLEMQFADGSVKKIPHSEMNDYYNKIDLYICASKIEGTPNPVLESMACGIPVISTDVGIVPDAFGEKQKEFILEKRSKEELKSKIIELIDNKEQFKTLSKENLEQIKDWDWKKKCEDFKKYFDKCLK